MEIKIEQRLKANLIDLLSWATSSARYESTNPYLIPVIKRCMKTLAELEGYKDYLELPLDTQYYNEFGNK